MHCINNNNINIYSGVGKRQLGLRSYCHEMPKNILSPSVAQFLSL